MPKLGKNHKEVGLMKLKQEGFSKVQYLMELDGG